jgi:hypothetical protein
LAAGAAAGRREPARGPVLVGPPEPREGTAQPPAAKPAARGSLSVAASQQANVYVDGEKRGLTPRSLRDVPLGSHTVRVTRPGYVPQEQTVVLTPEEPAARLNFTMRRADAAAPPGAARPPAVKSVLTVLVDSTPPGARIRIDGRELGVTPLMVRQMRPGSHTIELRLAGYRPWSQRITVAAGDDRRLSATLERDNPR